MTGSMRIGFFGDQVVQFRLKSRKDFVVRKCSKRFRARLEIHIIGSTPQPKIGVVRFSRTVDAASHDGDRDCMPRRVLGHRFYFLSEVDERFVFDSRTTRAGNNIQAVAVEIDDRSNPAFVDVADDAATAFDLQAFVIVWHCQGDSNGVANAPSNELLQRNPRLDNAIGRHTRLGDSQVQRNLGSPLGKSPVGLDDFFRIRILQRYTVAREVDIV